MPKIIGTRERSPFYESLVRHMATPSPAVESHHACTYCKARLALSAIVCRNCGAPVLES